MSFKMISKLKKLGLSGLVLVTLCGCSNSTEPLDEFRVNSGLALYSYLKPYGGFKREANDKDLDNDGKNDFYVEAKDGTIFTTHSSEYPPKEIGDLVYPKFYRYKKEK